MFENFQFFEYSKKKMIFREHRSRPLKKSENACFSKIQLLASEGQQQPQAAAPNPPLVGGVLARGSSKNAKRVGFSIFFEAIKCTEKVVYYFFSTCRKELVGNSQCPGQS